MWQKHRFGTVETAQCYSYEFVETEKLYESWRILSTKIHRINTVLWQKHGIWTVKTAQCYSYEFVKTEKLYRVF